MRILFLSVFIFLLTGCQLFSSLNDPKNPPIVVQTNPVIDTPPKLVATDWKTILSPLVNDLLNTKFSISADNGLLISDLQNNSGSYISSSQVQNILVTLFNERSSFILSDKQSVNQAKQALGIASGDTSVSRSKMIGLARYLKVNYVLFTTVNQVPSQPDIPADIMMELLLAKTGEIIWSISSDQFVANSTQVQSGL